MINKITMSSLKDDELSVVYFLRAAGGRKSGLISKAVEILAPIPPFALFFIYYMAASGYTSSVLSTL